MRRLTALALAASIVSACDVSSQGQPVPEAPPTAPRGGPPHPPPPRGVFPDFATFAPANLALYSAKNWHEDTYVLFQTPGEIGCFAYIYSGVMGLIECHGRSMPGFPADALNPKLKDRPTVFTVAESSDGAFKFTSSLGTYTDEKGYRLLPAGMKLTVGETGCAVGDDHYIACVTSQHHGFVISPTGSWTF